MFLKSEGFASNIYDSEGRYTLKHHCSENGLRYADCDCPVALDTFASYGLSFQQRMVPNVEDRSVVSLRRTPEGFVLQLDDGETVAASRVVVAVGLRYFSHVPEELKQLPPEVLSHSSDHHDFGGFRGSDVSVLGGGASALDTVAALRAVDADVRLIARQTSLRWNAPAPPQRAWLRWHPVGGLGPGWRNWFFERAPMLFRWLPEKTRLYIVRRWLGPVGGWPIKSAVEQAPILLGHSLRQATFDGKRVQLHLVGPNGEERTVSTERIIAATGYRVDLRRLDFLATELRSRLRTVANAPILSRNFESSVPGLYFVGAASANTFGPVMRFLVGARFTARRLANHLAKVAVRREAGSERHGAAEIVLRAER
jgi:thioredoxin reductase